MGSEAYPTLTRDDGDANAASCLLQDWCDAWRLANGLCDADYDLTGERKFHCPNHLYSHEFRENTVGGFNLRHCYRRDADGYKLVYKVAAELQLPFPEEGD